MKTKRDQIKHLKNIKDEDIDYSDIPPVEDFSQFRRVPNDILAKMVGESLSWEQVRAILDDIEAAKIKDRVSLRLDHDIVQYFKGHGKKYQTRINDILRAFMLAEKQAHNH
jgi:uncharacterized protein (DUF4415 family)